MSWLVFGNKLFFYENKHFDGKGANKVYVNGIFSLRKDD